MPQSLVSGCSVLHPLQCTRASSPRTLSPDQIKKPSLFEMLLSLFFLLYSARLLPVECVFEIVACRKESFEPVCTWIGFTMVTLFPEELPRCQDLVQHLASRYLDAPIAHVPALRVTVKSQWQSLAP